MDPPTLHEQLRVLGPQHPPDAWHQASCTSQPGCAPARTRPRIRPSRWPDEVSTCYDPLDRLFGDIATPIRASWRPLLDGPRSGRLGKQTPDHRDTFALLDGDARHIWVDGLHPAASSERLQGPQRHAPPSLWSAPPPAHACVVLASVSSAHTRHPQPDPRSCDHRHPPIKNPKRALRRPLPGPSQPGQSSGLPWGAARLETRHRRLLRGAALCPRAGPPLTAPARTRRLWATDGSCNIPRAANTISGAPVARAGQRRRERRLGLHALDRGS